MKRLTQDLALTAQQQAEIEPIVARANVATLELRFAHQDEVERILAKGMTEIKAKLSPTQQPKLDALYQELEQRWQASRDYLTAQKRTLTSQ
jgi:hypothetical protein